MPQYCGVNLARLHVEVADSAAMLLRVLQHETKETKERQLRGLMLGLESGDLWATFRHEACKINKYTFRQKKTHPPAGPKVPKACRGSRRRLILVATRSLLSRTETKLASTQDFELLEHCACKQIGMHHRKEERGGRGRGAGERQRQSRGRVRGRGGEGERGRGGEGERGRGGEGERRGK